MQISDGRAKLPDHKQPVPDRISDQPADRADDHHLIGHEQRIRARACIGRVDPGKRACRLGEPFSGKGQHGKAQYQSGDKIVGLVVFQQIRQRRFHAVDHEENQHDLDKQLPAHDPEDRKQDQRPHQHQRGQLQLLKHDHFQFQQHQHRQQYIDDHVDPERKIRRQHRYDADQSRPDQEGRKLPDPVKKTPECISFCVTHHHPILSLLCLV